MRLLFDQNMPAPLAKLLPDHEVSKASKMGWAALSNGRLLEAAEAAGFDVFVTADKNIRYQQNLTGRKIGIVVLSTQHMDVIRSQLTTLETAIRDAVPGRYQELDLPRPPLLRRPPPAPHQRDDDRKMGGSLPLPLVFLG